MPQRLRMLLLERYAEFCRRLTRRLGSKEQAEDVMQETWIRVDSMDPATEVQHPAAYLMRMASNIAEDRRRQDQRYIDAAELDDLMHLPDQLADPARIVGARAEVDELEAALEELPPRRRAILVAARVDGMLHRDIAALFGISQRSVEKELDRALQHCSERMKRETFRSRGPSARRGTGETA